MHSNSGGRAVKANTPGKPDRQEADALLSAAAAAYQAGRHAEARPLCTHVLRGFPDDINALHILGLAETACGELADAASHLRAAATRAPQSSEIHSNLGATLAKLGRLEEARDSYMRAIAIKPDYPMALNNLGNTLFRLRRFDEALASYDRAIALQPTYADAYLNRGMAFVVLTRNDEADADFDRALALKSGYLEAILGKGLVMLNRRQLALAIELFDGVLAVRTVPEALVYRGRAYVRANRRDEAAADYEAALQANPQLGSAWLGKAHLCHLTNAISESMAACERALALDPLSEVALTLMGNCHAKSGKLTEAIACFDHALAINPLCEDAIGCRIFALDFSEEADFAAHQAARKVWWDRIGSKLPRRQLRTRSTDPNRRIVIGYVSGDFREHSAAQAFMPILQRHDASRFEIACYSSTPMSDDATTAFRKIAHRWVDAWQMSDDALADRIEADQVDILVDLSGHTADNRLPIFARKPAPIQVTAWGHATGTGLATMDYLFSDPVAIPAEARRHFAETIYDLPALITIAAAPAVPAAWPPLIRNGFVTFGVFNRIDKISDRALALWAQILDRSPLSRIVIKNGALEVAYLREVLTERFVKHGVAADRVQLLGPTTRVEHLQAFETIDISLDPFPQNGGISTWESLQMGVPVIAKLGTTLPSRMSAAILASIGLDTCVAATDADYLAAVERLTADPDELLRLRRELPTMVANAPSGNLDAYTHAVEQAYRTFWTEYCAAQAGQSHAGA